MTIFKLVFIVATSLPLSLAHSWVEQLNIINLHGTMVGKAGYIRGTVSRLDPAFVKNGGDEQMQHLLPPNGRKSGAKIYNSDLICKETQRTRNYTSELPPLQARAGDYIALRHQENGHVSLPGNTVGKKNSGKIYLYGTSFPSPTDTLLSIHKVWDENGTGGDGRGRLLAVRPFDDGKCYQINDGTISTVRQRRYTKTAVDPQGANLWCQSDIKLPLHISKSYTLYWVWDWPSTPTTELPEGKPEIYTSCLDINILPGIQSGTVSYNGHQDLNFAAIADQL